MYKVNNKDTRTIASFEYISHLALVFLFFNFEHVIAGWVRTVKGLGHTIMCKLYV